MQIIAGQLYIAPKEVSSIPYEAMKKNLIRNKYMTIANPEYNGKNAKKLVLVNSLPEPHKQAILDKFQGDIKSLECGIENGLKHNPELEVTEIITQATANVVKIGERFIHAEYINSINKNYISHTEYFDIYKIAPKKVIKYARTCALIAKIWDDFSDIGAVKNDLKEFKRVRRAFVLNLTQLLSENKTINVVVPTSDYRLSEWMDKVLNAIGTPTSVYELVGIKNSGNDNNLRFTDEQKKIANAKYDQGNVPSITSIHDDLVEMGRERGWWETKNGEYKPISIGTLCNHFKDMKNIAALGRDGNMKFINNKVPSIQRRLPEYINEVWSIDGTPLDVYIFGKDQKGKIQILQNLNTYRVYDVGSNRWLSVSTWKGKGEPAVKIIEALNEAVKIAGVLPKCLQCDRGGGFSEIEKWCKDNGVIFMPANTGLARAKIAESLIKRFGKILRKREDWAGQNRTALGVNSQISPEQHSKAREVANTYEQTSHWLKTQGIDEWNDSIIKQLERKPCNKSPNQLWNEKPCRGIALDELRRITLVGKYHTNKLYIEGLNIQHNKTIYTYFPDLTTEEGRDRGTEVYMKTPLSEHPIAGKLTLYFEDYGSEYAYVFSKPVEKGGKYLDKWRLKDSIAYCASINNDTKVLKRYMDFQKWIKHLAKEQKALDDATFKEEFGESKEVKAVKNIQREKTKAKFIENVMGKEAQQAYMDADSEELTEEKPVSVDYVMRKNRLTGKLEKVEI